MKWSRMNEAQKERQREMCRAWYHRNIDAQRERNRKRHERERFERELAGIATKPRMNVRRFTAEELAKRKREQRRASYRKMMADPNLYSIYAEKRREYYESHREKFSEYRHNWKARHPEYMKMRNRLEYDRRMRRCAESPLYYAHHLEVNRGIAMRYLRRSKKVTCEYKPRMNRRTPFGCTFGRVLDTRSVFLWNNSSSASLAVGRAFKMEQWRDQNGNV